MVLRLAFIAFLALLTLTQKSWCQIVCQEALSENLLRQELVRSELLNLHQAGLQNPNSPLGPILRNKFYEKLQAAVELWGPSLEFLIYSETTKRPKSETPSLPEGPPESPPRRAHPPLNAYFESESHANTIPELVNVPTPANRSVIRPLPGGLPRVNFEYRISQTTFKEFSEYFFILSDRVLAIEPQQHLKRFFGPADMSATGAVSSNERYALLFHSSKILVWDLQNSIHQFLSPKDALYSFTPTPADTFKHFDTLYFKLADNGQWLVNPLHGFLINVRTGQMRKVPELTNLRDQEVQFSTDLNSEALYFVQGSKVLQMDLSQGLEVEPIVLADINNYSQQSRLPPSLDRIDLSPDGNTIAVRESTRGHLILFNGRGEILLDTMPFSVPQSRWADFKWSSDGSYLIGIADNLSANNSLDSNLLILRREYLSLPTLFTVQNFYGAKIIKALPTGFSITGNSRSTTLQKNYRLE